VSATDLQAWANASLVVQSIFFIVSVFFIWYQIREHNRLTRVANTQSLVALSSPFLLQLSQDRQLAELWVHGTKNFEQMDEVERFRYQQLLFWWLILHENIYYQYQSGLVDETMYRGWQTELQTFIRDKRIDLFWDGAMQPYFRADFQRNVEEMIRLGESL
jgi:hypothetical protein